jgi:hypothetical protein
MYLIHSFNAMNLSDNLHEGYSVFNILGGDWIKETIVLGENQKSANQINHQEGKNYEKHKALALFCNWWQKVL